MVNVNGLTPENQIVALVEDNKDLRDRLHRLGQLVLQNTGKQVGNKDINFGQQPEQIKAATIPIWDRGRFFSGYPTVEKALQYLGAVAGPTNEKTATLTTGGWYRIGNTTGSNMTTVLRIHWTCATYKGECLLAITYPDGGVPQITILSNKYE
jgi:hypothetical protein